MGVYGLPILLSWTERPLANGLDSGILEPTIGGANGFGTRLRRLASLTVASVSPKQSAMLIRKYLDKQDRQAVVTLWEGVFGYSAAHNDPSTAIDRKVKEEDGLFFVAVDGPAVLGTVMLATTGIEAGYIL